MLAMFVPTILMTGVGILLLVLGGGTSSIVFGVLVNFFLQVLGRDFDLFHGRL